MSAPVVPTAVSQSSGDNKKVPASEGDILSVAALTNAYATCHNVQDLLYLRGFTSKPAHAKRGKKGGKKRRKK